MILKIWYIVPTHFNLMGIQTQSLRVKLKN